jgi:DNA-binding LacI/PurR family transcriptional regulator
VSADFGQGTVTARGDAVGARTERREASPRLVTVARLARVSPSTVSRVVSGRGTVSVATRERVQKVIDRCGYHPDPMARGLRTNRSAYVMVLHVAAHSPAADPRAGRVFEVVERIAEAVALGGGLAVFRRVESVDRDRLRSLAEHCGARAVVLVGSGPLAGCWSELVGAVPHLEVVEVGDGGIACHDVPMDERRGAATVVRHLVEAGCSDIAYLGDARHPLGSARHQGYRDGCGRATGASWALQYQPDCGVSLAESLEGLLTGWRRADGLFAATDALGVAAINALRELRLLVPGDVRIAAMGGTLAAATCVPPLTTLAPAGEEAISAIAQRLRGDPPAVRSPAGVLVIRASSRS